MARRSDSCATRARKTPRGAPRNSRVAATSPIVLLFGGLVILHERLQPLQWVGVTFVFCSMGIIAFG